MSNTQQSHDLDLESGKSQEDGGGGPGNEIVRVSGEDHVKEEKEEEEEEEREERRESNVSVEIVDLEACVGDESKVHLDKSERDCRICHLSLDSANQESGVPIELGCSCKDDLAAAHKQCAEAWFKIKGNRTCEICGSIAQNITPINETETTDQWDESTDAAATAMSSAPVSESRNFWQGHRFLNFLLACMVFAFVISWLFHFNVPS